MSFGLTIARKAYQISVVSHSFNTLADLCGKAVLYKGKKGEALIPNYRFGLTRLVLSDNPFWNNPLMQRAYHESPKSKTMLAIMHFLIT